MTGGLNFGEALAALREGKQARRAHWETASPVLSGVWVRLVIPHDAGRPMFPQLVCYRDDWPLYLLACSQLDILAEDWEVRR